VVGSGVTTYQSSRSAVWRAAEAVYQTGRLMEWWGMSKGVGRRGGKRGSRV